MTLGAAPRTILRRLVVCGALLATSTVAASEPDDTARFLAGKGADWHGSLADHAATQTYTEYAGRITSGWKHFQEPNLERTRSWWKGRGPAKYSTVFYPFSGPDLGNALAFFPDADTYLMFGLEAPGAIPDLHGLDEATVTAGLHGLESSLSTLLRVNYFFTRAMEKKLGNGSFNSISSLLLFFLATTDCEVTSARRVAIGRSGALVDGTTADDESSRARVPGVEITFRRAGSTRSQTVRYFMVDVADQALAKRAPGFVPYLESQQRFATMIKSASYLMHEDRGRFDRIRSLILGHSDFIMQDDSGIPLRLFARDTWKLRFHGKYAAPTPEFVKHLQKDLKIEMQRNSSGKLPFSYGYAFKQGESNLMTAAR